MFKVKFDRENTNRRAAYLGRHAILRNLGGCDYCGMLSDGNCNRARQPRNDRHKNHRR
jgi:hypothetical protein